MKSAVWDGDWRVTTRLRYSNGKPHGGLDIAMPIGTRIYAPVDAVVVAMVDGVPNNKPSEDIWSGKPSNWILLSFPLLTNYGRFQPVTLFIQHLNKGIRLEVGEHVSGGQFLARSGNTGNSTGPHTHFGAQWIPQGERADKSQRYDHVSNAKRRVWPLEGRIL